MMGCGGAPVPIFGAQLRCVKLFESESSGSTLASSEEEVPMGAAMTTSNAWRKGAEPGASREQLQFEIRKVLKALAEIDARCENDRANLEKWMGAEGAKKFSARLEAHRRSERQALVLRLADLHERMAELTLLRA
jgi:hypothetical protein